MEDAMTGTSINIMTATPSDIVTSTGSQLLLDVRTAAEFEDSHIHGAVLHPLSDLNPGRVKELASSHAQCFLVCGSGGRARQAYDRLKDSGIQNLRVLEGGMRAWEASGNPTIKGRKTISLERQVRIAAGSLVLLGVILGYTSSSAFFALSGLIGAGLIFAGITDTCGMGMMLAKMPWNRKSGGSSCATR